MKRDARLRQQLQQAQQQQREQKDDEDEGTAVEGGTGAARPMSPARAPHENVAEEALHSLASAVDAVYGGDYDDAYCDDDDGYDDDGCPVSAGAGSVDVAAVARDGTAMALQHGALGELPVGTLQQLQPDGGYSIGGGEFGDGVLTMEADADHGGVSFDAEARRQRIAADKVAYDDAWFYFDLMGEALHCARSICSLAFAAVSSKQQQQQQQQPEGDFAGGRLQRTRRAVSKPTEPAAEAGSSPMRVRGSAIGVSPEKKPLPTSAATAAAAERSYRFVTVDPCDLENAVCFCVAQLPAIRSLMGASSPDTARAHRAFLENALAMLQLAQSGQLRFGLLCAAQVRRGQTL